MIRNMTPAERARQIVADMMACEPGQAHPISQRLAAELERMIAEQIEQAVAEAVSKAVER